MFTEHANVGRHLSETCVTTVASLHAIAAVLAAVYCMLGPAALAAKYLPSFSTGLRGSSKMQCNIKSHHCPGNCGWGSKLVLDWLHGIHNSP